MSFCFLVNLLMSSTVLLQCYSLSTAVEKSLCCVLFLLTCCGRSLPQVYDRQWLNLVLGHRSWPNSHFYLKPLVQPVCVSLNLLVCEAAVDSFLGKYPPLCKQVALLVEDSWAPRKNLRTVWCFLGDSYFRCMFVKIGEIFLPDILNWQITHLILLQSVFAFFEKLTCSLVFSANLVLELEV